MISVDTIQNHQYPDGSRVLPISENAGRIGALVILLISVGIGEYLNGKVDALKWGTLLPTMALSVCFLFLVLLYLTGRKKKKAEQ